MDNMTMEIGVVFAILGTSIMLFVPGWIRADIVAVLVLVLLAATGVLDVEEVLKGFSSEAVIAIVGLLILSAGWYAAGWTLRARMRKLDIRKPKIFSSAMDTSGCPNLPVAVILRRSSISFVSRN